VTLKECLDLMPIYEDQSQGFFVKRGVHVDVAGSSYVTLAIGRIDAESSRQEPIII
jgi:hypothetical protein